MVNERFALEFIGIVGQASQTTTDERRDEVDLCIAHRPNGRITREIRHRFDAAIEKLAHHAPLRHRAIVRKDDSLGEKRILRIDEMRHEGIDRRRMRCIYLIELGSKYVDEPCIDDVIDGITRIRGAYRCRIDDVFGMNTGVFFDLRSRGQSRNPRHRVQFDLQRVELGIHARGVYGE